jgi:hypothetical protein
LILHAASFTESANFNPVIARPVWDDSEAEPVYNQPGWFPGNLWSLNAIVGGWIVVVGQFNQAALERLYGSMV